MRSAGGLEPRMVVGEQPYISQRYTLNWQEHHGVIG